MSNTPTPATSTPKGGTRLSCVTTHISRRCITAPSPVYRAEGVSWPGSSRYASQVRNMLSTRHIRRRNFSPTPRGEPIRSEEHTSELQSRGHLVCRLLLEKKKNVQIS